ncbi:MAG: hypothetical protein EB075_12055, partial [Bacteroidetes bacterium]|nr:hypothetical protein [Bacteroidota bacterium]
MTDTDGTVRKKGWFRRLLGSEDPQPVEGAAETPSPTTDLAPTADLDSSKETAPMGWAQRLRNGLKTSSHKLSQGIGQIFSHRALDDQALEDL